VTRPPFRLHVVACEGTSCRDRGSRDVVRTLRRRLAERGLAEEVRVTTATCLDLCGGGPNLVVYPDGVWYTGLSPRRVARIVDEHLVEGRPVEELRVDWEAIRPDEIDLDSL
jgi:(2Fe-2S) ferredoxin